MAPNIIFSTLPCSGASALDPIFRSVLPAAGYELTPFGPEGTSRLGEFIGKREPFYHWTHDPPETFSNHLRQRNFKFIYLHRDLRDVAISYAHDLLLNDLMPGQDLQGILKLTFTTSTSGIVPHARSAVRWLACPEVLAIDFVAMKSDIRSVLDQCFAHCGVCVAPELLDQTISRHSFEALTGRRRGATGPLIRNVYMLRKGVAGEYKVHFNEELAVLCHQAFGCELIALGYEKDSAWLKAFQPEPPGDPPSRFRNAVRTALDNFWARFKRL